MKHTLTAATLILSVAFATNATAGKGGQGGYEQGMEQRSEQGQMHHKAMEQHQYGTAKEKKKAKQSQGPDEQAMDQDMDQDQSGITE